MRISRRSRAILAPGFGVALLALLGFSIWMAPQAYWYFMATNSMETGERLSAVYRLDHSGPLGRIWARNYSARYFRRSPMGGGYVAEVDWRGESRGTVIGQLGNPIISEPNADYWIVWNLDDPDQPEPQARLFLVMRYNGNVVTSTDSQTLRKSIPGNLSESQLRERERLWSAH
jgi:hypothetical protein